MQSSYCTWIPHAIAYRFLSIELCLRSVNRTWRRFLHIHRGVMRARPASPVDLGATAAEKTGSAGTSTGSEKDRIRDHAGQHSTRLDSASYTRPMDRLWTPWRYSYITGSDPQARSGVPATLNAWPPAGHEDEDKHCVFCNMIAAVDYAAAHGMERETAEKAAYIVHRGVHCFVCLNAFPYSTGHMLIVPYQHLDSLAALPPDAAQEIMLLAQRAELALREVYRPGGINMGLNLGEAAGAGIADHIHLHVLPRWSGDTNFMTVTAETRILPEPLDATWAKLKQPLWD